MQLVNFAAFELITGLATPKTPVTYYTYLLAGLPFHNIHQEKASTISGALFKVKTISEINAAQEQGAGTKFDLLNPPLLVAGPLMSITCKFCFEKW